MLSQGYVCCTPCLPLFVWEMVMGLATSCTHDCDERNGRTVLGIARRQCKTKKNIVVSAVTYECAW